MTFAFPHVHHIIGQPDCFAICGTTGGYALVGKCIGSPSDQPPRKNLFESLFCEDILAGPVTYERRFRVLRFAFRNPQNPTHFEMWVFRLLQIAKQRFAYLKQIDQFSLIEKILHIFLKKIVNPNQLQLIDKQKKQEIAEGDQKLQQTPFRTFLFEEGLLFPKEHPDFLKAIEGLETFLSSKDPQKNQTFGDRWEAFLQSLKTFPDEQKNGFKSIIESYFENDTPFKEKHLQELLSEIKTESVRNFRGNLSDKLDDKCIERFQSVSNIATKVCRRTASICEMQEALIKKLREERKIVPLLQPDSSLQTQPTTNKHLSQQEKKKLRRAGIYQATPLLLAENPYKKQQRADNP